MPRKPRRRGWTAGIILAVIAVAAGAYVVTHYVRQALIGSGCQVGTGSSAIPLDTDQAAIAATIAGVAARRAMPAHAVQVAYAAAFQESHLHNLHYGDQDSVGVFQQRPSEGWGPRRKLEDPVYASTRFFQALAKVPGYLRMPVYQAAQAVQRSADGYAYQQYQRLAGYMSAAFTGQRAHAVWCWSPDPPPGKPRLAAARKQLVTTFGEAGAPRDGAPGDAAALLVSAKQPRLGWALAAWLVTHAHEYRIHQVGYDGWEWNASAGRAGWTRTRDAAAAGEVRAG